ncbi:MAG: AmmeMemoRadiSam system radical SAM enzyme [Elusimicrobiota bacterium]
MKRKAYLYKKLEESRVKCNLCAHRCVISSGSTGICGVRKNEGGQLYTTVYGESISAGVDPIEKKPLYHVLPGSGAYSIATVGCNFKCGFCQNWRISQTGDTKSYRGRKLMPEKVVENARSAGARSIAYTYTEPTVFFEYAYDTARLASQENLKNIFVTNGFMSKESLDMIQPYLDAANVDLKYFKDSSYRENCKGRLKPVLENIEYMKKLGIWVEVTTLIIPGENDSDRELEDIAGFIAGVDKNIPWHISRFVPQYKYDNVASTPVGILEKAIDIGKDAGLKFIYLGNVGQKTVTRCLECEEKLISRTVYNVGLNRLTGDGKCPDCGQKIPGIWS